MQLMRSATCKPARDGLGPVTGADRHRCRPYPRIDHGV